MGWFFRLFEETRGHFITNYTDSSCVDLLDYLKKLEVISSPIPSDKKNKAKGRQDDKGCTRRVKMVVSSWLGTHGYKNKQR